MKFDNLVNTQNAAASKNLNLIEEKYVVYLGATPRPHYPKQKDHRGVQLKDENGRDLRASESDGTTWTFSTIGDNPRIVSALVKDGTSFEPMNVYKISGFGYEFAKSNFIWLEEISNLEQVEING
jgi:hypothetical protein